ncbi:MAG: aminotransferase class I/II-fold pyridoxal phosphate-dependent enzyme [Spirochaetales bacterium]|nr:aminotransferase class I/II-fold pyridoxal phosphate-dependent enzyme [Spirochaetales bacterium]
MFDIPLDRHSATPLYCQIRDYIIDLIANGELKSGNQLPPTRELAEELAVNRTTVYQAYRELWSLGYTESRPGSYSYIRDRKETHQPVDRKSGLIDWDSLISTEDPPFRSSPQPEKDFYDFRTFSPLSDSDGADKFRKCLNDVLRQKGKELLLYGDPYGYHPLRDDISGMMSENQIDADRERILITDGAQNGLDLICKLFRKEKWAVVTAEPTYSEALSLFRYYGAEILTVPLTPAGGFYLWFDLSDKFGGEENLLKKLKDRRVLITGGSLFLPEGKGKTCLRMSIARGETNELEEGVITFCHVLKEMLKEDSA